MGSRSLNRQVVIKSRTAGEDADGQPLETWTVTVATVWADIRYLSGTETIKGGAETSTAKASIRLNYRTNLTTDMRVVYGSTVFQIKAILPDASGQNWLDLACEVVS